MENWQIKHGPCKAGGVFLEWRVGGVPIQHMVTLKQAPIYTNQQCCGFFNALFSFLQDIFYSEFISANLFTRVYHRGLITDYKHWDKSEQSVLNCILMQPQQVLSRIFGPRECF